MKAEIGRVRAFLARLAEIRRTRRRACVAERELIQRSHRRLDALAAEAATEKRLPTPAELEELARLDALITMLTKRSGSPWSSPWALAAGALVVVGVAGVLSAIRVDRTVVDLDARASELSFTVPAESSVLESADLAAVDSRGIDQIAMQRDSTQSGQSISVPIHTATLTAVGPASITLNELRIPAKTQVVVSRSVVDTLQIDLYPPSGQTATVRITVTNANLSVPQLTGRPTEMQLRSTDGLSVTEASQGHVTLALSNPGALAVAARRDLPIESLALLGADSQSLAISTVESGTVLFEGLNGKTHVLRKHELLAFGGSGGTLRSLETVANLAAADKNGVVEDSQPVLNIAFSGVVSGMISGVAAADQPLMPTLLEWLNAQPWLGLLWGTVVSGVGLVAVLRKFISSRSEA